MAYLCRRHELLDLAEFDIVRDDAEQFFVGRMERRDNGEYRGFGHFVVIGLRVVRGLLGIGAQLVPRLIRVVVGGIAVLFRESDCPVILEGAVSRDVLLLRIGGAVGLQKNSQPQGSFGDGSDFSEQ